MVNWNASYQKCSVVTTSIFENNRSRGKKTIRKPEKV